nr:RsbRD N-terminal domain-containing protein [Desulfobulbaceae bacterium]
MNFKEQLKQNLLAIEQKWIDSVLATYSSDGARFFKKEKDQFANPLGFNVRKGLEKTLGLLVNDQLDELPTEMEQLVKLRAVQTFGPSEAVGFVFFLKKIVIEECGLQCIAECATEWSAFEGRVDDLAMRIFDLYMKDRELISQIRVNEYRSGNHIMAGARCPSAMTRKSKEEKIELKVIQDS